MWCFIIRKFILNLQKLKKVTKFVIIFSILSLEVTYVGSNIIQLLIN